MSEIFFDSFHTFICVGIDRMSFSIDECTELDSKLLESIEI